MNFTPIQGGLIVFSIGITWLVLLCMWNEWRENRREKNG